MATKEAEGGRTYDDDGDEVMYRSAGGGDGEGDGDVGAAFELPEFAMPISRQRARLVSEAPA